jgi:hypothetical protein
MIHLDLYQASSIGQLIMTLSLTTRRKCP